MGFFFSLTLLSCIFMEYSLTVAENNYIRCTSDCPQTALISFSDELKLSNQCQEHNDALICAVEFTLNYDTKQISIRFQSNNDTADLHGQKFGESFHQKIWLPFDQNPNKPAEITRKYICNLKNDCAKDFYLNTIDDLVKNGQSQLNTIKGKLHDHTLLVGKDSRRRCTDSRKKGNKTSVRCGEGLCFAQHEHHDFNEDKTVKTQKCESSSVPHLHSEIRHYSPKTMNQDINKLEFKCNKNVCNRNDMIVKIQDLIKEYTKWIPKEIPQEETTAAPEKKSSLSTKTIASYILILFLVLLQLFI